MRAQRSDAGIAPRPLSAPAPDRETQPAHEAVFDFAERADYRGLLTHALEHAPALTAARERALAAAEGPRLARALPDPELMVGFDLEPIQTRTGKQGLMLGLMQGVPWPGRLAAAGRVAEAEALLYGLEVHIAARELARELAERLWELWYLERAAETAAQVEALAERYLVLALAGRETGGAGSADLVRAEIWRAQVGYDRQALSELAAVERARVRALVGLSADANVGPVEPPNWALGDLEPAALAGELLAGNLDLLRAEQNSRAAREESELAGTRARPDLRFGVRWIETRGYSDSDLADNGKDPVLFEIGMSLPVQVGVNRAATRAGRARLRAAEADRMALEQGLRGELAATHYALVQSRRLAGLHETELLPQAERNVEAAEALLAAGAGQFAALIERAAGWQQLALAAQRAQADRGRAEARLAALLGRSMLPAKKAATAERVAGPPTPPEPRSAATQGRDVLLGAFGGWPSDVERAALASDDPLAGLVAAGASSERALALLAAERAPGVRAARIRLGAEREAYEGARSAADLAVRYRAFAREATMGAGGLGAPMGADGRTWAGDVLPPGGADGLGSEVFALNLVRAEAELRAEHARALARGLELFVEANLAATEAKWADSEARLLSDLERVVLERLGAGRAEQAELLDLSRRRAERDVEARTRAWDGQRALAEARAIFDLDVGELAFDLDGAPAGDWAEVSDAVGAVLEHAPGVRSAAALSERARVAEVLSVRMAYGAPDLQTTRFERGAQPEAGERRMAGAGMLGRAGSAASFDQVPSAARAALVEETALRARAAEAEFRAVRRGAGAELEAARLTALVAAQRLRFAAEEWLPRAVQAASAAEEAYAGGRAEYATLVAAEMDRYAALRARAAAVAQVWEARARWIRVAAELPGERSLEMHDDD